MGMGQILGVQWQRTLVAHPHVQGLVYQLKKHPKDLFWCLTLELQSLRELDLRSSQLLAQLLAQLHALQAFKV